MNDLPTWDHLLHQHVDRVGRVDYQAWITHHPQTLARWLAEQSAATHGREDHLAHWINLYNAFTIQAVLSAYPIISIRPTLLGLPNWIAFLRFFQRRVHRLGPERLSLEQIENRMLRQITGDPRIHFAIVCASVGCPLLRHEAYTPERVEAQLEEDASRFINNPAKVRFEPEEGVLYTSKIFQWYRADFMAVAPSLPAYILPRLRGVAAPLHEPRIAFLPYDWSLNQRMSS
ncbi:DUF547 domain-containing protein [Synechococcus sp. Tobar12-5m-g]|uniref:DUF547 domain-containing protein n=1 Tax=unclassified Synechococcus TaxID=2626047 RepID=UPI0020CE9DF6|nr:MULTISPECIES: DUF547 domain-containing protein [unclassified Synechococcus]MCP9772729.1 DUF547 domain-containing protein [Synechococcus sp. Tobar12-5m-g]MCP9873634.1 DUF547 domain-containing protein [Synechococcus sp. Cruz CV-v-12]